MLKRILSSKVTRLAGLTIVMCIVFYLIKPVFLGRINVTTLFNDLTPIGFMLLGVVPLMISGGIDLAAAAEGAIGSMLFAQLLVWFPNVPWGVCIIVAMLAGALMGYIIVLAKEKLGLFPFIASLGLQSIYNGFASLWTKSNDIVIARTSYTAMAKTALFKWIPIPFIVMVVLVCVYAFIMKHTTIGRKAYIVGGNAAAARLAGVSTNRVQCFYFINAGVMAVLAGCAWAAQKKLASPTKLQVAAPNFSAISAGVLGGIAFGGGSGTIFGAFVAMILVKVFTSGMILMGLASYFSILMQGGILILALVLDNLSARRVERARRAAAMSAVHYEAEPQA